MRSSNSHLSTYAKSLLLQLMATHFIGTIFAYTVYINVSSLGDGYQPEFFDGFNSGVSAPTLLVHGIYAYLGVFLPGFLAPMALGQFVAVLTWYAFRSIYSQINPKLFWACNLFPHFLVWSGSSSKEQIVIICGIIIINFAVKRIFSIGRLSFNTIFILIPLFIIYFIRPNYFIIYFTVFLTSFSYPFFHKLIKKRLSVGLWLTLLTFTTLFMVIYLLNDAKFINEDVVIFMKKVEASFLSYDGGSNRHDIEWSNINDFLYNAIWGLPQGFIGPTLIESINKPLQIPVFFEGLIFLCVLVYLFLKLFKLANKEKNMRIHLLPYLFASLLIIFVSYPYLIFNPGSALRYKQSMHPILIFYPLLILAYARKYSLIKVNTN